MERQTNGDKNYKFSDNYFFPIAKYIFRVYIPVTVIQEKAEKTELLPS